MCTILKRLILENGGSIFNKLSEAPPALRILSVYQCNIGSSWSGSSSVSGASWIIRNSMRKVLYHSRRSFSGVVSKAHASLLAMSCASAAVMDLKLKNTVFEFSYSEAVDALNNPLEVPSCYYMCYDVFKNVLFA